MVDWEEANGHNPWAAPCLARFKKHTSIDPKQLQNDSLRPILIKNDLLVRPTFTPRAKCLINEFLSALTTLFVRQRSSPVIRATEASQQSSGQDKDKRRTRPGHSRATEPSHRVQGRGQDKDKRRTRRGQEEDKAQPQRTRGGQGLDTEPSHRGQKEDKAWTEDKRRTRPGHRAQPQSPGTEDKAWTQSPATEDKRRTRPGHRYSVIVRHAADPIP